MITDIRALRRHVRRVRARRRHIKALEHLLEAQGALPESKFRVAVYYSDSRANLYQIRQWYRPLEELSRDLPVVIIARRPASARTLLEEAPVPVVYAPKISDVEIWLSSQPVDVVLYVNHAMRNFQMMRYGRPSHVSISHGESDKASTSTNQFKAYDFVFVAGQAAEDRIADRLIGFDVGKRLFHIGRPQVDVQYDGMQLPDDGRINVLYAPTWEGDRPSMNYTSIISHGLTIISNLLGDDRFRIIYRAHPRVGSFHPEYRAAHLEIMSLINEAMKVNPTANHVIDSSRDFGWHLQDADVCLTDISAVAYDWLATGKPLIVCWPEESEADLNLKGLIGLLEPFDKGHAAKVIERIEKDFGDGARRARQEIAEYYFGCRESATYLERFIEAVSRVAADRAEERAAISNEVTS